jgi:tripartite-type tricarboxylate transporter receptor subunit TctC
MPGEQAWHGTCFCVGSFPSGCRHAAGETKTKGGHPMTHHILDKAVARRDWLKVAAAGSIAALGLPAARAQDWPSKPIKIIVTFPPGGSSDVVARIMAEHLPKRLNQSVVVDNRPGAGGTIGGSAVSQSPADGYTLMLSNTTPIALGPFTLEKQPYDPVAAFTHIAPLGTAPLVIMAHPAAGMRTLADLEARAKREGRLDFGSGGPGSIGHILGELYKISAKLNLVHIPYRGGAPMTTDLLAGTIPVGIDVITSYLPFFKTGQLVPLAVTSAARSPLLPTVPSVTELGQPKLVLENFFGLSGPPKLPADVASRLTAVCNEILGLPEVKAKFAELAITPTPGTQEAFAGFVRDQVGLLGPAVRGAGIKM